VALERQPRGGAGRPAYLDLGFRGGDIVAIDGKAMSPGTVLADTQSLGGANGIGRAISSRTATWA
jgi:argininosuccinate synthase